MALAPLIVLVTTMATLAPQTTTAEKNSPILIFPGIMGSRLLVKDERDIVKGKHLEYCNTKNKLVDLWISNDRIISRFNTDREATKIKKWQCTVEELMLDDNYKARYPGVEVVTPESLEGVKYLTDSNLGSFSGDLKYFIHMVDYFEHKDRGYKGEEDIRAAPYDWRLAADQLKEGKYYERVEKTIEDMYNKDKRKVTLVAHSMGGLVSHYFLTEVVKKEWKDKFIHAYVTLSAAWSGGVKAIAASVINVLPDGIKIPACQIVPVSRTWESGPWIFPKPTIFTKDPVLVKTKSKEYKVSDYEGFFKDIGQPALFKTYQRVSKLNDLTKPPGVPTHCFYGVELKTPEQYSFEQDFSPGDVSFDWTPDIEYGDGDGTVNLVSSEACLKWEKEPGFTTQTFKKLEHTDIVKSKKVFEEIAKIVKLPELSFLEKFINNLMHH